jgi:hypothetical protein
MRRIFKMGALLVAASSLWLGGCGQPAAVSEAKTYTIRKHKVSMTPPKDWKERQEEEPKGEVAAVVFEPPDGKFGHIAVTITPEIAQTQEFMDRLGNAVVSRKGKILGQDYEHKLDDPDQKNAYWMEFSLEDGSVDHPKQKGKQYQIFTKDKILYSLVFTADPEVYDANKATFEALVKSFEKAK